PYLRDNASARITVRSTPPKRTASILMWSTRSWQEGGAARPAANSLSCGFCSASAAPPDRKSTRLNSSHLVNSYAVFCLKKKKFHRNCVLRRLGRHIGDPPNPCHPGGGGGDYREVAVPLHTRKCQLRDVPSSEPVGADIP